MIPFASGECCICLLLDEWDGQKPKISQFKFSLENIHWELIEPGSQSQTTQQTTGSGLCDGNNNSTLFWMNLKWSSNCMT